MSEREFSADRDVSRQPERYEDLVAVCKDAKWWTVEALCRRYVAANRDDLRGWLYLLDVVEWNGNADESIRLTRAAMEQFPQEQRLPALLARRLLDDARVKEAGAFLEERLRTGRLTYDEAKLFGHLLLLSDPPRALRWFETLSDRKSGDRSLQLDIANTRQLADRQPGSPLVAFYLIQDWHYPIQRSTYEAASATGICSLITNQVWLLTVLKPKVVVVSDTPSDPMQRVRKIAPKPLIVNTRHGISDKNYTWYSAGAADRVCTASQSVADDLIERGLFSADRFWVTGYPQMDSLFHLGRGKETARNVLFAPTWTPELSAGVLLGEGVVQAIRGNDESIRVTVKPHPHMRNSAPALLHSWRASAKQLPNVHLVEDATSDLNALMADAAILVSDVSSVAVQYLALDRPIVCVIDPAIASTSRSYAPGGIEWQLHAGALIARDAGQTARAVREALEGRTPPDIVGKRRALRDRLLGDLIDGRAGERIAAFIRRELESQH